MENQFIILRDTIINYLKQDSKYSNVLAVEKDGLLFAGADVALLDNKNDLQIYRIVIIPHKLDYSIFTT
ncbi:MAG: hypothetical protein FWE22_00440 [Firmicutes bacterium]|nr:hypothetical protein [Bacillota bacterium]